MPIRFTVLLQHGRMDRGHVLVYIFEKILGKRNSVTELLSVCHF